MERRIETPAPATLADGGAYPLCGRHCWCWPTLRDGDAYALHAATAQARHLAFAVLDGILIAIDRLFICTSSSMNEAFPKHSGASA
jgi:hypothetical protein